MRYSYRFHRNAHFRDPQRQYSGDVRGSAVFSVAFCEGVGGSAHGGSDVPVLTRACLVIALTIAGSGNEAITAANSVLDPSVAANLSRVEAEHGEPASWWARRARNSYIL
jgi:hypothetical protein